jgi:mannose-1-phosphate guanylyltransferase
MAGGSGSRLWPISREKYPKQFICVDGDKCMLLKTMERICKLIPAENCFVITNHHLAGFTKKLTKNIIPNKNIMIEPKRCNTAACISYATFFIQKRLKNGIVGFFPADGYVGDQQAYLSAVAHAYEAAERLNKLVIIGIEPSYPATGYGYLHVTLPCEEGNIYSVKQFVEKPDVETAKKFISSKDYWWNSGIVVGSVLAFVNHIRLFLPEHFQAFSSLPSDFDRKETFESIQNVYHQIPNISFDNGVLERSSDIVAVKSDFDWDDIGNLESLSIALTPDSNGNKTNGKFLGIDTHNSIVYSNKKLVTAIGLNGIIIAVTDDAVLVCPKDRVQDVKVLVDRLKESDFKTYT